MDSNPNLAPNITHAPTLLGGAENMKLLFDDTMSDISHDRKLSIRHGDAWETLRILQAQNLAFVSHLANVNAATSGQTGQTEDQNLVKPISNTVADDGAAVASAGVDSAVVDAALGNVTAQISDLTTQVAALAALLAQYITNAGNAAAPAKS